MSHLYTTKVTAVGGRSGTVKSDDGILGSVAKIGGSQR